MGEMAANALSLWRNVNYRIDEGCGFQLHPAMPKSLATCRRLKATEKSIEASLRNVCG
jgi:hypothetical protein